MGNTDAFLWGLLGGIIAGVITVTIATRVNLSIPWLPTDPDPSPTPVTA